MTMIVFKAGELLKERGISVQEAAERLEMSEPAVYKLMASDHDRYYRSTLERLCKLLDVQPGDLLVYIPEEEAVKN